MKALSSKTKHNIFIVINSLVSILTMVFVLLLTGEIMNKNVDKVSTYLGISIITLVLSQILLAFVHKKIKDKIRVIIIGIIYTSGVILSFLAKNNYIYFYIATVCIVSAMAINQFLLIEKEETKKGVITNILLGLVLVGLVVAILCNIKEEDALHIVIIDVVLLLFTSLRKLFFPSLKFEKIKLLLDILIKTHTIDAVLGLLAFIIAFSFLFPLVEPSITNYWDGMWYCFAIVTTIGFGDFYATSLLGRILSVILGIYGIVVVAILTSVVVSFYNEISSKEKKRDIIE